MPIASQVMSSMKIRNTLAAFLLLSAHAAYACMPGQNFDVHFSSDSATVSASEILRLANWIVDQRIKYPTQEVFQIDGRAEDREHNAHTLAKARLQAVVSILEAQHFNQVPMDEHYGVYRSGDVENGKRVEISILPVCPNSCCPHDDTPTKK